MNFYILLTALFPIGILLFYIWRKDKEQPEPMGWLVKAFFFGVLSVLVSFCISIPLGMLGLYSDEPATVCEAFKTAFYGAAIPEECAKLFMLWLVLRKNPYFDEKMDGIVYAVFVSLGFAAIENVMYLFDNYDSFLEVGVIRALFAVPGHFCYGVLMGYYYSLVKFYPKVTLRTKCLVLLAPVVAHGFYDAILMSAPVLADICWLALLLMVLFLYFCHKMWKYASLRIKDYVGQ